MARVTITFDVPDDLGEDLAARRIGALARSSGLATSTRRKRRGSSGSVFKLEAPDHIRRARGIFASMVRFAAKGDLDQLGALHALARDLDAAIDEAALASHAMGYSWAQIAEATGMKKQSAYERWAKRQPEAAS